MTPATNASRQLSQSDFRITLRHLSLGLLYIGGLVAFYLLLPKGPYRTEGSLDLAVASPQDAAAVLALYNEPIFTQYAATLLVNRNAEVSQEPSFSAAWLWQHVSLSVVDGHILRISSSAATAEESREIGSAMLEACAFTTSGSETTESVVVPAGYVGPMKVASNPHLTEVRRNIVQTIEASGHKFLPGLPVPGFPVLGHADQIGARRLPMLIVGTIIWAIVGVQLCLLAIRRNQPVPALS